MKWKKATPDIVIVDIITKHQPHSRPLTGGDPGGPCGPSG
jgi:hypothetical protein